MIVRRWRRRIRRSPWKSLVASLASIGVMTWLLVETRGDPGRVPADAPSPFLTRIAVVLAVPIILLAAITALGAVYYVVRGRRSPGRRPAA